MPQKIKFLSFFNSEVKGYFGFQIIKRNCKDLFYISFSSRKKGKGLNEASASESLPDKNEFLLRLA